jgi:glycosyltransferase involved in cell wall biosynthesis
MQCEWLNQLDATMLEPRLRHADLILGCSEYIAEKIRDRFPDHASRCFALVNGVDIDRFSPADDEVAADRGRLLVFVGRVSPEKGIHVLLEAFTKVIDRHPDAHLEIIGPQVPAPREYILDLDRDPLVRALEPLFRRGYRQMVVEQLSTEVTERVTFVKNIPADEVIERYRRAALVVFPSVWNEPFGMPIVEAMACAIPVVTTRGGGIPEIVEHGKTGLLVDRGDSRGLAAAMIEILDRANAKEEMGRRGRSRAIERYSWLHVADGLLQRISEISSRP